MNPQSRQNAKLLLESVPRAMHLIRLEMRSLASHDLTVPQYRILANLHSGLETSSELADWIGVTLPAMSRMIDLLVRRGLIERAGNPEDRRQIKLHLSDAGKDYYLRIRRGVEQRVARYLEELTEAEGADLGQGLEILAGVARRSLEERSAASAAPAARPRRSVEVSLAQRGAGRPPLKELG